MSAKVQGSLFHRPDSIIEPVEFAQGCSLISWTLLCCLSVKPWLDQASAFTLSLSRTNSGIGVGWTSLFLSVGLGWSLIHRNLPELLQMLVFSLVLSLHRSPSVVLVLPLSVWRESVCGENNLIICKTTAVEITFAAFWDKRWTVIAFF